MNRNAVPVLKKELERRSGAFRSNSNPGLGDLSHPRYAFALYLLFLVVAVAVRVAIGVYIVLCKAKQASKAKMFNGHRHVPLCPASANEKINAKVQYNVIIRYLTSVPDPG